MLEVAEEVVSRDPYTGEEVLRLPAATEADVAAAVERGEAAVEGWSATPVEQRAAVLRRFADSVEADADELTELLVREVGKRREDAAGEVAWTALSARWYADHPPSEERAGGARVVRAPLGVIAAVTPWNVPLITPAWKWLPALMAGNAVVWKPSERATAVALAARRHLLAAGVPEAALAVLAGGAGVARALCADERVNGVHFTGSERAGRALAALAAPRFARCALEMSGLNPAVVLEDADLDLAARCIVDCATALAGQKCTATRRVLVAEAVREPLEARLAAAIRALAVGDPRDPATDVGPLIGPDARAAADAALASARAQGARVVAEAQKPERPETFVAPTLLADLPPDAALRERELFAPVLTLDAFATPDDAWRLANAAPYGLSASLFGRDEATLREGLRRIRAGVLAVNRRGDAVDLEAPFGGHKRSGNGQAEGGTYVYDSVTELQAIYGA
jgi:alpha-ketoglutaric semialdehyde dehydrogenase